MESNPFRSAAIRPGAIEYRLPAGVDWNDLDQQLQTRHIAQVVGDHGTGKSTFVETYLNKFSTRYRASKLFRLNAQAEASWTGRMRHRHHQFQEIRNAIGELPQHSLVVVDGAEQLSALARRQIVRLARSLCQDLIFTTHRKFTRILMLHRTFVVSDRLRLLSMELLRHSSESVRAAVQRQIISDNLDQVTNVRDYWFDLYDVAQNTIADHSLISNLCHTERGSHA